MAAGRNVEPPGSGWRTVAKAMYEACGSPEVPGYPAQEIALALSGRRPLDLRLAAALVGAVRERMRPASTGWLPMEAVGAIRIGVEGSSNVVFNVGQTPYSVTPSPMYTVPEAEPYTFKGTTYTVHPYDATKDPRALTAASNRPADAVISAGIDLDTSTTDTDAASPAPSPASAKTSAKRGTRREKGRIGHPPDPEAARTVAEFLEATRQLLTWSGLSVRDFEEASRAIGDGTRWIPKSTLQDIKTRRDRLPRPDQLETIVAVIFPSPEDQTRWMSAHARVLNGATPTSTPQPAPEPATHTEPVGEVPDPQARPRGRWLRRNRKTP